MIFCSIFMVLGIMLLARFASNIMEYLLAKRHEKMIAKIMSNTLITEEQMPKSTIIEPAKIPIVAAIHGTALGGGAELTFACHYRVMDERARIAQNAAYEAAASAGNAESIRSRISNWRTGQKLYQEQQDPPKNVTATAIKK